MSPAPTSARPSVAFAIPGDLGLPTGGYAYDRRLLALLPDFGIDVRHLQVPGAYPNPIPTDLSATRQVFAATPPGTLLLIDGLAYGAMPVSVLAALDRTIVALVHHPLCLEAGLSSARARELAELERHALAFAAHVIVTSPATARILEADFAVAHDKITVAEPGTDPAPRAMGTRTPLQLLAVGTVVPRKGYDVLVRALAGLTSFEWKLAIAGALDRSPATADALTRQIVELGLADRVAVLGAVDETTLDRCLHAADIFVTPSLYEGYGMALAEAMARGLPIVCTTGGAAAETVPDDAALKVPPGDARALAVALERIMRDPSLRRNLADASWSEGRHLPSWQDTARLVSDAIRKVAA